MGRLIDSHVSRTDLGVDVGRRRLNREGDLERRFWGAERRSVPEPPVFGVASQPA